MKKLIILILLFTSVKVFSQNSVEAGSVLQTSHQIYLKNASDTVNRRLYILYPNGTADREVRWPELLRQLSLSKIDTTHIAYTNKANIFISPQTINNKLNVVYTASPTTGISGINLTSNYTANANNIVLNTVTVNNNINTNGFNGVNGYALVVNGQAIFSTLVQVNGASYFARPINVNNIGVEYNPIFTNKANSITILDTIGVGFGRYWNNNHETDIGDTIKQNLSYGLYVKGPVKMPGVINGTPVNGAYFDSQGDLIKGVLPVDTNHYLRIYSPNQNVIQSPLFTNGITSAHQSDFYMSGSDQYALSTADPVTHTFDPVVFGQINMQNGFQMYSTGFGEIRTGSYFQFDNAFSNGKIISFSMPNEGDIGNPQYLKMGSSGGSFNFYPTTGVIQRTIDNANTIFNNGSSSNVILGDGTYAPYTSGTGTVTSVSVASANGFTGTVATATTTPAITLTLQNATTSQAGQLTAANFTTFNNKQNAISLTTTGTSGAATFASNVLNIPQYAGTTYTNGYGILLNTSTFSADTTSATGLVSKSRLATNLSGYLKSSVAASTYQPIGNYIVNSSSLQTGAVYNVEVGNINQSTPVSVTTSIGTNTSNVFTIVGGAGGSTSNSGSTATGGTGSTMLLTAGAGGSTTGTPTSGFGGAGGAVQFVGGAGGTGTTVGGIGGFGILQGGTGGFGSSNSGGYVALKGGFAFPSGNGGGGSIYLSPGAGNGTGLTGITYIGVSPSGTIRGNTVFGAVTPNPTHLIEVNGTSLFTDQVTIPNGNASGSAINLSQLTAFQNSFSNGFTVFGNSISAGTGATNAYLFGYAYLVGKAVGGPFLTYANSGDQVADLTYRWLLPNSNVQGGGTDPITNIEIGTNDVTTYNTNTNQQTIFKRLLLTAYTWPSIPKASKVFGQAMTLVGFTTDNNLQSGLGITSTTNGNTATSTINTNASSFIYLYYLIRDGDTGTFTFKIDGTLQTDTYTSSTTINAFGDGSALIATANGVTSGIACLRFPVASGGAHTCVVTNNGTTGQTITIYAISTNPITSTSNPYTFVVSPNHQNNANDATSTVYAGFTSTIAAQCLSDGLNVNYVDTRTALGTNYATYYSDGLHPNNAGHALMASTETAAIAAVSATLLKGNVIPSVNQNQSVIQPFVPMNPTQFWSPNASRFITSTTFNPGILFGSASGNLSYINYQPTTGLTVGGANAGGTPIFSVAAYTSPSGIAPSTVPTLANTLFNIQGNAQANFFTNSSGVGTVTFQSQLQAFGNFTSAIRGSGALSTFWPNNYVQAATLATTTVNVNSPNLFWTSGIYNGSSVTVDDLGFQSRTSAGGANPNIALTLVHGSGGSGKWGLDLSSATNTNLLGKVTATHLPNNIYQAATGTTSDSLRFASSQQMVEKALIAGIGITLTQTASTFTIAGNPAGLIIGTPTIVAGTGAGTSPTVTVTSNGRSLQVTVTTGTLPTGTNATIATVTLANALTYTPYPVFSGANANTSLLSAASMVYMTSTGTANVTITSGTTALTAATTYVWNVSL